jgi:hypothetical protein
LKIGCLERYLGLRKRKYQNTEENCGVIGLEICTPDMILVMQVKMMRWAVHVSRLAENRNAYTALAGKPAGGRPFRRHGLGKEGISKFISKT